LDLIPIADAAIIYAPRGFLSEARKIGTGHAVVMADF
jgi:hypothetical protein